MNNNSNKKYIFSCPPLQGDRSAELLMNPCRGFRLEISMSVDNGNDVWTMYDENGNYVPSKGINSAGKLEKLIKEYADDCPRISQVYFYLTAYNDRELDDRAIENMNGFLEKCRELKITVALRFAYVSMPDDLSQDCVSFELMKKHMRQLKPVLRANRDVLFCLEGGFMGEWGEQSEQSYWVKNGYAGKIMDCIVDMVPEGLWVLARYASVRNAASEKSRERIGYHNDYIVGVSHGWDSGKEWSSAEYKDLVEWSGETLVEGEMPWGWGVPFKLNGLNVARYLKTNHYTAFSCFHNNHEGGNVYDLVKWKNVKISKAELESNTLPYYHEWFENSGGVDADQTMDRSVYEYIRDFLGYNIMTSDAAVTAEGKHINLSFSLKNNGFAAPLAMKQVRAVIVDEYGNIVDSAVLCPVNELKSGVKKDFNSNLQRPDTENLYSVGIFLEAWNGEGAKLANDIPMINGINILGELR